MTDPTREEVLAYLGSHPGTRASDAVTFYWPNCSAEDRRRHMATIRSWQLRARRAALGDDSEEDDDDLGPEPDPEADRDRWLTWQLGATSRDIAAVRRSRDRRAIPALLAAASKLREELDALRAKPPPAPITATRSGPILAGLDLERLSPTEFGRLVELLTKLGARDVLSGVQLATLPRAHLDAAIRSIEED